VRGSCPSLMSDDWTINEGDFERLLGLLAPDRDVAAERFVTVWRNLVRTFASRCCHEAEDLADETMFRVARKTRTLKKFVGDFALYIYRVGRFIYREWLRRQRPRAPPPPPPPPPPPKPPNHHGQTTRRPRRPRPTKTRSPAWTYASAACRSPTTRSPSSTTATPGA
jgi:DNA-directed RNA polymerase specialized sigma24 family protein